MSEIRRHKSVIRIFFNTFYESDAQDLIDKLSTIGEIRVERSKNVPELYYIEIQLPRDSDLSEAEGKVREILTKTPPSIFGVKIYSVKT